MTNHETGTQGQDHSSTIDDILKQKQIVDGFAKESLRKLEDSFGRVLEQPLNFYLELQNIKEETLKRYLEALVDAAARTPWWRDPDNSIDMLIETFSPAAIVRQTLKLSKQMWERDRDPDKYWKGILDHWRPAQTAILEIMKASINATQSAVQAGSSLLKVFEAFNPTAYLDAIDKLAWCMWHDSGCPAGNRMRFWLPAEKHILAISAAAVAAAKTATQATTALDDAVKKFNPRDHQDRLRKLAYLLWEDRHGSKDWDPPAALQDWTQSEEKEIQARSTTSETNETE